MKFGVREICDVTFKAAAKNQKVGTQTFDQYQPVFVIDTAQTSEMSQESTTVYAQGGKGYNRLIAWEGEKTMTFTVTDALMSPMGLAVLSGAGLINASKKHDVHVHATMTVAPKEDVATISYDEIANEVGITDGSDIRICADKNTPIYATLIDGSNDIIAWLPSDAVTTTAPKVQDAYVVKKDEEIEFTITGAGDSTVNLDLYIVMNSGASEITIAPEDFGGFFYVEADTLFRREDTGVDMAATLTFPRVKVQSGFTFTMAASGDPSTFDFTMDAFPGYTRFDSTKKVCVTMSIIEGSGTGETAAYHASNPTHASI